MNHKCEMFQKEQRIFGRKKLQLRCCPFRLDAVSKRYFRVEELSSRSNLWPPVLVASTISRKAPVSGTSSQTVYTPAKYTLLEGQPLKIILI